MSNEEKKMSGHKHAALMLQYAEDAAKTDKPWELWKFKHKNENTWDVLRVHPSWSEDSQYRRKPVKWEPVGGNWWIRFIGDVVCNGDSTPYSREFGTERQTCEQAKRAAVEMRKFNRLLALRDELCGDDVVDWSDFLQEKYTVFYDHKDERWGINENCYCERVGVYFTTRVSAQLACDMLNSGEVEL